MIVVEAFRVEALLVKQELDHRRCAAGIGFESSANFSFDGIRDWGMGDSVPDRRATEQVFRPRPAEFGPVDLG
jgi:hypothetical protein